MFSRTGAFGQICIILIVRYGPALFARPGTSGRYAGAWFSSVRRIVLTWPLIF